MVISYSFFFFLFLFKFARRSLAISLIEGTGVGVIRFSKLKINVIVKRYFSIFVIAKLISTLPHSKLTNHSTRNSNYNFVNRTLYNFQRTSPILYYSSNYQLFVKILLSSYKIFPRIECSIEFLHPFNHQDRIQSIQNFNSQLNHEINRFVNKTAKRNPRIVSFPWNFFGKSRTKTLSRGLSRHGRRKGDFRSEFGRARAPMLRRKSPSHAEVFRCQQGTGAPARAPWRCKCINTSHKSASRLIYKFHADLVNAFLI